MEAMPTWDERSHVLLEQVEAICKKGRAGGMTYMQAVQDIENLHIGPHLAARGQSSLRASRGVHQYQRLLELFDLTKDLPGWGQKHDNLLNTALDIALDRLSPEDQQRYDKWLMREKKEGFIAPCADPFYTETLTRVAQSTLEESKALGKPFGTVLVMGTYPCPDGNHRMHSPASCASQDDKPSVEEMALVVKQMRAFSDVLERRYVTDSVTVVALGSEKEVAVAVEPAAKEPCPHHPEQAECGCYCQFAGCSPETCPADAS
jgi:hypothetical protein